MSDLFYKTVSTIGGLSLWTSATPTIRGLENVPKTGPCILAATHTSYFDVPLLMHHTPRLLDTVSITEEFKKPLLGWFYGSMNAFPLDRSRADPSAVRVLLDRLARGRTILIFPEGGIRSSHDSVIHSGRIRPGIGRIARLAQAPVIPAVVINSAAYQHATSWLPLCRTRYGVSYGPSIPPTLDAEEIERQLVGSMQSLHEALSKQVPAARP